MIGPTCWEWLERLCGALPELGVVVCTGSSTVAQRVRGLRLGADDWLTKPCHPEELIARVESVVRRRRRLEGSSTVEPMLAGEVEIQRDQYQAFVPASSIDLTRREFELIELLAASGGRVLEREFIYQRLWGYAMVRGDRSVDVFVRKLRQKLERVSPEWRYIHTHFGIGYRFAAEPTPAPAAGAGAARIRAQRRARSRSGVAAPRAGDRGSPRCPPFFISTRAPVIAATSPREVRLVPDQQQRRVRRAGRSAAARSRVRRSRR